MRLFDKIASQGSPELKQLLIDMQRKNGSVLCVDEIAHHYSVHEQLLWGAEDFPYAIPPWDIGFIEWVQPKWLRDETGLRECHVRAECGGVFQCVHGAKYSSAIIDSLSDPKKQVNAIDAKYMDAGRNAEHALIIRWILYGQGQVIDLNISTAIFLDANGSELIHCVIGTGYNKMVDYAGAEQAERNVSSMRHVVMLAFTFANCKNVSLDDSTTEYEPLPKIKRRLRIPDVRRYTLTIGGSSTKRNHSTPSGETGIMPFHLCRGHFATYTAEKPLFGKLVGRFWIPPHTKGRKERGIIEKDYAINSK